MSITSDLSALVTSNAQEDRVIQGRAALQNWMWVTEETVAKIQTIVDAGELNLVAASIKAALNKVWVVAKSANNSLKSDADIQEMMNWRP